MEDNLKYYIDTLNNTLVLVSDTNIIENKERGIGFLLSLVKEKKDFSKYIAYDKVIGKGVALLYVELGIKKIFAKVISEPAYNVLKDNKIAIDYRLKVPNIINRKGDDLCPMEKAVLNINDSKLAIIAIETTIERLKGAN